MTPDWFTRAIAQTPEHQHVEVMGKSIHVQTWGDAGNESSLLFVHGHAAHAHWWDFIAPEFCQQFYVAALDLSGNGDSEHRTRYSASQFAAEINLVAESLGTKPIVIAHSFGGSMARIAAHYFPDSFKALVLVDSVISGQRRESTVPGDIPAPRIRYYDSVAQAARRFRLRPPQPRPAQYILDYIGTHSVKATPKGYQFKLDPQVFDKMWPEENPLPDGMTMIQSLKLPAAYIYGEQSRFCPPEVIEKLRPLFLPEHLVKIRGAYHHVFLDQPVDFVGALRELLKNMDQ